jgi:hypothetical protein
MSPLRREICGIPRKSTTIRGNQQTNAKAIKQYVKNFKNP